MEPIISPWIFYIIGALSRLEIIIFVLFVISICLSVLCGAGYTIGYVDNEKNLLRFKTPLKKLIISTLTLCLLVIILPDKQTMYTMLVSREVTYDRLEIAKDSAIDARDYIVNLILSITETIETEKDSD